MKNFFLFSFLSLAIMLFGQEKPKHDTVKRSQALAKRIDLSGKIDLNKEVYFPNQVTELPVFATCENIINKKDGFLCLNQVMDSLILATRQELKHNVPKEPKSKVILEYQIDRVGEIKDIKVYQGDEKYKEQALIIMQSVADKINQKVVKLSPARIQKKYVNMLMRTLIHF